MLRARQQAQIRVLADSQGPGAMKAPVRSPAIAAALFWCLAPGSGCLAARRIAESAAKTVESATLRADLFRNTIRFVTPNGKTATAYLAANGRLRGSYEGRRFNTGRWSIKNSELCLRFPNDPDQGCWSVVRYRDGRLRLFTRYGTPVSDLGVSEGNPGKF